jgi:hypothetical protein
MKGRMVRFELFIGVWNTTGEVLATEANPAGALVATDTYRWLPGKHFMVHDVDARFDGKPARSMEVVGYDGATRRYVARSYDDAGLSEIFTVALSGRRWRISGEQVRFNGSFNAAKNRLSGLWERKSNTSRWDPWIRLELVRAEG